MQLRINWKVRHGHIESSSATAAICCRRNLGSAFDHWEISKPHINAGLKQARQESDRAGKTIDLGHDQRRLTHTSGGQRFL